MKQMLEGYVSQLKSYDLLQLFQVSTQQAEMDSKFIAMKRTIALLEKYDQKLPEMTEKFYTAAPQRCVLYIRICRNNHEMVLKETNDELICRISNKFEFSF